MDEHASSAPAALQGACMNLPLDMDRLADVLRGGERSRAAFLGEFRRSTDADVDQLLQAAAGGDLPQVERLAHRIEGASRLIGAQPLAGASATLAVASRSGEAGRLRLPLDALLECRRNLYAWMDALDAPAPGPQGPAAEPGICDGLVFLVVDDHEFQLSTILRLLRQLGAREAHGFADGAGALAAARAHRGDAILVVDLAMPALNGMEVMRIVGEEGLPLSAIMNSALAEDMLAWPLQTARSYGATVLGAVSKPLTAAKLAPLLAEYRHAARLAGARPH
jgi:CheY-like chemotaxis protein/HPt (histidine-containing phosphotransfer) domain-containing protein